MADVCSRLISWTHCSDNNRALATCQHFSKDMDEFLCPLQVREDKGTKNRLINKHMLMLRHSRIKVCIGSTSAHTVKIERLWLNHKCCTMIHFYVNLNRLEWVLLLDKDGDVDTWSLHKV